MEILDTLRDNRDRLQQKRSKLCETLSMIDNELSDIETAIRVIERTSAMAASPYKLVKDASERMSIRGLIHGILEQAYPEGLTVHDVVERATKYGSMEVNQNTASVTLGRIKNDGFARLDGRYWYFQPREDDTLPESKPESQEAPETTNQ